LSENIYDSLSTHATSEYKDKHNEKYFAKVCSIQVIYTCVCLWKHQSRGFY